MAKEHNTKYFVQNNELMIFPPQSLTSYEAHAIFDHIKPLIEEKHASKVSIDLSKTSYIDSTAVGTFLKIKKLVEKEKGCFVLCDTHKDTKAILENMKLLNYFNTLADTALEQLRTELLERIPPAGTELSADFVHACHDAIVKASPEMEVKFRNLLNILSKQIANCEDDKEK